MTELKNEAVVDDAVISRVQDVLTAKGIKIDGDTVREMLSAAATPKPDAPEIPVSLGMVTAGRELWVSRPSDSVHILLPALYRVMDQTRRDEAARAAASDVQA